MSPQTSTITRWRISCNRSLVCMIAAARKHTATQQLRATTLYIDSKFKLRRRYFTMLAPGRQRNSLTKSSPMVSISSSISTGTLEVLGTRYSQPDLRQYKCLSWASQVRLAPNGVTIFWRTRRLSRLQRFGPGEETSTWRIS